MIGDGWCCVCGESMWEGHRERFRQDVHPVCGRTCIIWWQARVIEPMGWSF